MKAITMFFSAFAMMFAMMFASTTHAQITSFGGQLFAQEYVYDFAKQGGAAGFISLKGYGNNYLPRNAVILSAHYTQLTAFTASGAATVAIGDAASGTKYLAATAYNNAAFTSIGQPVAISSGLVQAVSSSSIANVGLTVSGGTLIGGKMRVVLQGYIPKGN